MSDKINIKYFLDNKPYASRTRFHVPRTGDEVRFKGVCYSVHFVLWVEDEDHPHVAINILPIV